MRAWSFDLPTFGGKVKYSDKWWADRPEYTDAQERQLDTFGIIMNFEMVYQIGGVAGVLRNTKIFGGTFRAGVVLWMSCLTPPGNLACATNRQRLIELHR